MYIIKRFGRRFGTKTFDSYESARSYLRKLIRNSFNVSDENWEWYYDYSDAFHCNPAISRYGFKITAV